ncbi:MAG: DUF2961 domain-containing protein [Neisseria sp.]|nr:DUF2961 domain-containing protein [Neisseria sp.]
MLFSLGGTALAAEYGGKNPIAYDRLNIQGNRFAIEYANERGHTCGAKGAMGKDGVWKGDDGCKISFRFKRDMVKVDADGCDNYCGEGVSFPTEYYKLPPACTRKGVGAMENRFQTAWRAGKFKQAANIKQNHLQQCGGFLNPTGILTAANDAAHAYLKAGDRRACIQTLDSVQEHYETQLLNKDLIDRQNKQTERGRDLRKQCG